MREQCKLGYQAQPDNWEIREVWRLAVQLAVLVQSWSFQYNQEVTSSHQGNGLTFLQTLWLGILWSTDYPIDYDL